MQCLFAGKAKENLSDVQKEIYDGLFVINNEFFYSQPLTIETDSYVKYRSSLITEGVCKLRDQAIRGEISLNEFWTGYELLKEKGLDKVMSDGEIYYKNMVSGGTGR